MTGVIKQTNVMTSQMKKAVSIVSKRVQAFIMNTTGDFSSLKMKYQRRYTSWSNISLHPASDLMFFAVILTRGNHVVDKSKVEYPTRSSFFRFGILPSDLMGHIPNWMSYIYYEISCALTFEVNLTQWSPGYLTSTPSFSSFLPAMFRG